MHGAHQDAQKLSKTGFSAKSERLCVLPLMSVKVKSGAAVRADGALAEGSSRAADKGPPLSIAQPATAIKKRSMMRIRLLRAIFFTEAGTQDKNGDKGKLRRAKREQACGHAADKTIGM